MVCSWLDILTTTLSELDQSLRFMNVKSAIKIPYKQKHIPFRRSRIYSFLVYTDVLKYIFDKTTVAYSKRC